MKKLFKGKFKIILPILMATVALVFAVTSVMGAEGDVVISNPLTGSADILPGGNAILLEWSTVDPDDIAFVPTDFGSGGIDLVQRMGDAPTTVWVRAISTVAYSLDEVLFIADYDATLIEVIGSDVDGTWEMGDRGDGTQYWGPSGGFLIPAGAFSATASFTVTPLTVGSTEVIIYAIQLAP